MSSAVHSVGSVDDLFRLDPLARFEALIAGENFPAYLRAEPITFAMQDPVYGYFCGVQGCALPATHPQWWCARHGDERHAALRRGVGEAAWRSTTNPFPARTTPGTPRGRLAACRFCPDRDAVAGELCRRHHALFNQASRRGGASFIEEAWAARQVSLPGTGDCQVSTCGGRAELEPALCPMHRRKWVHSGAPTDIAMAQWLWRAGGHSDTGMVYLGGLPPLLAAEIRYGLWAHTQNVTPTRWHPMWLRTLVKSCTATGVGSLLELDAINMQWSTQARTINRIVQGLRTDVDPVHYSRGDTRERGYLDTDYWGFRFPDRRSVFDLTAIGQRWLRDLTWDYLADLLDGSHRPRTQGVFEQVRRSMVCFSTYLLDCDPERGHQPARLSQATARGFVADYTRRVTQHQPARGVFNKDGTPSTATTITYSLAVNALRRVMRAAMDSGAATALGLPRDFIVALPFGGTTSARNPRPFSDQVLRALSDPTNIAMLHGMDPNDGGLADIWSIQVRCGRRISEVVKLRWDCVSEHLGRTWLWVDMTKVGKLDYAIQIPRDVYDLIRARQVKTAHRYQLKHGTDLTATQRRTIALFPSRVSNPSFERSLSASTFAVAFKTWIESDTMRIPGHTTHQARHTLATRLIHAGASMTHVKQVLGQVSERMADSYVLIAGSQVEPFLQQVWVTGPGAAQPGQVVLTPTATERNTAHQLLVDLAAVPTEHGLCTFKPVVGGFDCPFGRNCHSCEHFVLTGADYGYWKRQEQRWAVMAEGAPDTTTRDYIYASFARSSQALAGLEKALHALGLLDQAKDIDLRSPQQDFFDPIWRQGWRTGDLLQIGASPPPSEPSGAVADINADHGRSPTS